jgi:membrane fusion protein, adhesin transport system
LSISFARTTRSLSVDSSRFVLIGLGVAALALLAWLLWFAFGSVTVYEVSRQARLEVGSAPRDVTPIQAGRLVETRLVIGKVVRAGDVLVALDATPQQLRLAEAEARLLALPRRSASLRREADSLRGAMVDGQRSAIAEIQSARARLSEASAAAEFARESARRQRADSLSGGSPQVEALKASSEARRAEATRAALSSDVIKLGLDARTRGAESAAQIENLSRTALAVDAEIAATRELIAQLRIEIENRLIRAPIDGVIGEILPLRAGAVVAPGQKLATIVPSGQLLIVAEFNPATAIGRIRPDQRAQLRLDGFPWAQFGSVDAKVLRVAGEIRDRAVRVELSATRDATRGLTLRHGMTGMVEVSIEDVSPAMLLLRTIGQSFAPPARKAPAMTASSR